MNRCLRQPASLHLYESHNPVDPPAAETFMTPEGCCRPSKPPHSPLFPRLSSLSPPFHLSFSQPSPSHSFSPSCYLSLSLVNLSFLLLLALPPYIFINPFPPFVSLPISLFILSLSPFLNLSLSLYSLFPSLFPSAYLFTYPFTPYLSHSLSFTLFILFLPPFFPLPTSLFILSLPPSSLSFSLPVCWAQSSGCDSLWLPCSRSLDQGLESGRQQFAGVSG